MSHSSPTIFNKLISIAFSNMHKEEIVAFCEPFFPNQDIYDFSSSELEEKLHAYIQNEIQNSLNESSNSINIDNNIEYLKEHGYTVIENILTCEEIERAKELFYKWLNSVENLYETHRKIDPHFIFKFHEVGHQEFAWYIRTLPNVQAVFQKIWNTKDLIVSYDGSCYFKKDTNISQASKQSIWTHTDQAPKETGRICIQGFVSLTSNTNNTLVVYDESHKLFKDYFDNDEMRNSSSRWNKIDPEYLKTIEDKKRILNVPAGSLVLWDSRIFHQNQITEQTEERLVQYVCYLPRNNKLNTNSNQNKRKKYFQERRTTSHWPYPIKVNGKQPQTYGNDNLLINYENLQTPDLSSLMDKINKLI